MPVLAVPPRAVGAAPGPAVEADVPLLHMPAQAELLPLQPSKLAVYKLFTEQVRHITSVTVHMVNPQPASLTGVHHPAAQYLKGSALYSLHLWRTP